jgi:hydroxymethylglutaryl-CoA lyase
MDLPKQVSIVEVGPRDGFQNISTFVETEDKINIIKSLATAGLKRIEVTSFVNPKWIPQMKDAKDVVKQLKDEDLDMDLIALVPNRKGAENAIDSGVDTIGFVVSVSDAHNKANVNRTVDESFKDFLDLVEEYPNSTFRLCLATVFGCPFDEKIDLERVSNIINIARSKGVSEILLADTIGVANPLQMHKILSDIKKQVGTENITLHIHDTRGMGMANILVALELGYTSIETSIAGLGGCPFAPGAAGNVATEDLVNMLNGMNIQHNVDLELLKKSLELIKDNVDAPITSHMGSIFSNEKLDKNPC